MRGSYRFSVFSCFEISLKITYLCADNYQSINEKSAYVYKKNTNSGSIVQLWKYDIIPIL